MASSTNGRGRGDGAPGDTCLGIDTMTPSLELLRPEPALRDAYRGLVAEFVAAGEKLIPFTLAFPHDDFAAFLARLDDCASGIGVPSGFVAHSTFWLVRDRTDVVGVSNIRHSLTPALSREGGNIGFGIRPNARRQGLGVAILRHSLVRAREIGLTRALVTCGSLNVASAGVIRRNAGVFESEEYLPDRGETVQRYWIEIPSNARA
jgi:predicted acetyltransferase